MNDVIVVGGGPAGSTAAAALVAAGAEVVVVDRAVFPRDKPCAGWVTPQVFDALGIDPREYGERHTLQPITAFRTGRIGDRALVTSYDAPVSYGIRRCEFDAFLLRRSGATVIAGTAVERIERRGGEWHIDGRVSAPVLVGAGGHFCPVARHLNRGLRDEPIVAAREVEFAMTSAQASACPVSPERPELYFCRDLRGYGWCFRKGAYLNVGFGRLGRDVNVPLRAFADWLRGEGRIPAETPARWPGHAYLVADMSPRTIAGDGVVLVGDAAGLAYAASGEGIRPAVESGLLAADAIVAAAGGVRGAALDAYATTVRARFARGRSARLMSRMVPHALVTAAGALMLRSPALTRAVLLDGWFLHKKEGAVSGPRPALPRVPRDAPCSSGPHVAAHPDRGVRHSSVG